MSRQRKKERTKRNHTWPHFLAIPNLLVLDLNLTYLIIILGLLLALRKAVKFTCTITSVPSISRVAFTYMWSNGICATSIHMTRVISFTFVNIWEIKDERKRRRKKEKKNALKREEKCYHHIFQLINLSWAAASADTNIKSELTTISKQPDKETDQMIITFNSNQVSNGFWDYWL